MRGYLIAALGLATAGIASASEPEVPWPSGYRDWHHVKSMVIEEGHPLYQSFGGIHHIYANDKAMEGYRAGRFPDGSVLVFDLLEALRQDNAIVEGPRKVVGVMYRDSLRFTRTGGWGFEGFGGGNPANRVVGANAESACFSCHSPRKEQDYTFSELRD